MKLHDTIGLKGHFKILGRYSPEDPWKLLREQDNLIVNVGRTMLRDFLSSGSALKLQSFAVGTGTTAPALTDTGLGTAVPYSGANIYKAYEEFTEDDYKTVTYVGYLSSIEPAATTDITEIGLFTGTLTTAGTMLCRATFDAITKTSSLELRIEYQISI